MTNETVPTYSLVRVETTPEDADAMVGRLTLLGADGIEERDATTLQRGGSLGVTLVASFPTSEEARRAAEEIGPAAVVESLVGDAWRDAWKLHWRPTTLCAGIVVVPSWIEFEPGPGENVLRLDPGRAFGTGQHASTALAAQSIVDIAATSPPTFMLDLGCGSGVLSFVAVMCGIAAVEAWDIDPDSVAAARENAEQLAMLDRVAFRVGTLADVQRTSPLVVANIEAGVLVPGAATVSARVEAGGALVLSGILSGQRESVEAAYVACGLTPSSCLERGEWISPVFRRPG